MFKKQIKNFRKINNGELEQKILVLAESSLHQISLLPSESRPKKINLVGANPSILCKFKINFCRSLGSKENLRDYNPEINFQVLSSMDIRDYDNIFPKGYVINIGSYLGF